MSHKNLMLCLQKMLPRSKHFFLHLLCLAVDDRSTYVLHQCLDAKVDYRDQRQLGIELISASLFQLKPWPRILASLYCLVCIFSLAYSNMKDLSVNVMYIPPHQKKVYEILTGINSVLDQGINNHMYKRHHIYKQTYWRGKLFYKQLLREVTKLFGSGMHHCCCFMLRFTNRRLEQFQITC